MSNLDVAVGSFWQLARHWKNGDKAKLELSCEGGSLLMELSAVLGLPDQPHFPHPPPPPHHAPPPPTKKKSPSQLRRQERRLREAEARAAGEAVPSVNINYEEHESELGNNVSNPKATEIVVDAEKEKPAEKLPQISADESYLGFQCNQCEYSNPTEKGLGMHVRKKHRISQVDGVDDSSEEKDEETFDSDCVNMIGITDMCMLSCSKKFSTKEDCYRHMYMCHSQCCVKMKLNLVESGYRDDIRKDGLQTVMVKHTLKTHGL
jgi:hypothetical protein